MANVSAEQLGRLKFAAEMFLKELDACLGADARGGSIFGGGGAAKNTDLKLVEGADYDRPRGVLLKFGKYRGYGVGDCADGWYLKNFLAKVGLDENGIEKADDEYAESNRVLRKEAEAQYARVEAGGPWLEQAAPAATGVGSDGLDGEEIPF